MFSSKSFRFLSDLFLFCLVTWSSTVCYIAHPLTTRLLVADRKILKRSEKQAQKTNIQHRGFPNGHPPKY